MSLEPPVSDPPAVWVRKHGFTTACRACADLQAGKRASGSHSAPSDTGNDSETVAPEGVGIHIHGQSSSSRRRCSFGNRIERLRSCLKTFSFLVSEDRVNREGDQSEVFQDAESACSHAFDSCQGLMHENPQQRLGAGS